MNPVIKYLQPKKLIGMHIRTSLTENKTSLLWKNFMPRRREIQNKAGTDLISMQIYDQPGDMLVYNPDLCFDRWAASEVSDFTSVPAGMETYVLTGGLYAVFMHKGGPATGFKTFQYIFSTWLPGSGYELDDREHFELLGDNYRNDDPHSEEEIWIPVKTKE